VTSTTEEDSYTYDENGNQVERVIEETTWTLAYNAENRLASLGDGNGNSEAYLYDGDGVRVARVRVGEATYLFMGGLYEVSVELPAGTVTGSKSYYSVEGQMLAMSDGSTTQYLLTDHLGSVVGVVGESVSLLEERRYLPFGEARTLVGAHLTDLSFTGQRELTGTGLLDYHARQYDPSLRTFIQADSIIPNPYGVLDYNRYLYVHANPVRFTDPSGNRACGDGEVVDCEGRVLSPVQVRGCGVGMVSCGGPTEFIKEDDGFKYKKNEGPKEHTLEDILNFSRYGKYSIELMIWIGDYGQPAYKQLKGIGYTGTIAEGSIGAILQLLNDFNDPTISERDRAIRAAIIGGEDALTDLVSGAVAVESGIFFGGLSIGTGLGAVLIGASGYIAGSYLSTIILDKLIWAPVNAQIGIFP
jgi:RHS repeat-associated protein